MLNDDQEERSEKALEARMRRKARSQGLNLHKSRRRDPMAKDYGGYWCTDEDGYVVWDDPGYGLSLDDVVRGLSEPVAS